MLKYFIFQSRWSLLLERLWNDTLLHAAINILHLIYFSFRPEQRWKQTKIIQKNIWTNTGTVFPISGEGNAVWNVHNLTCQDIFEPLRQIWEYLYNFTAMQPLLCEFLLVTWRLSLKSAEYYSSILLYVMSSPLISAVANFVGNSKFLPGNNLYNILFVIRQREKAHQICTISTYSKRISSKCNKSQDVNVTFDSLGSM